MSYTLDFSIALGPTQTGLTLIAQLLDSDGTDVGSPVGSDFAEVGTGCYIWSGTIPDKHRGIVKFYEDGAPSTILAVASINSENDLHGVLTEGYAADGSEATFSQMLYMILAQIANFEISGNYYIAKKLDGTTQAMKCAIGGQNVKAVTLTRTE